MPGHRGIAAVVTLAALTACTPGYLPRSERRLSVAARGNALTLVRDGKLYAIGGFFPSDEPLAAVAGDPLAEAEMRAYHSQRSAGAWISLVGLATAATAGGAFVVASNNDSSTTLAWSLLVGSVVVNFISMGFIQSAGTHLFNAVNIYNDDLDGAPPSPR